LIALLLILQSEDRMIVAAWRHFDMIPDCDRWTDRQTDRQNLS